MKRISIVGLSLLAMMVVSAVTSSSAFAGEYGRCVEVESMGKYANEECTHVAPGPEGEYEWEPGVGPVNKESGESGPTTLTSASGVIECAKSTSVGEITGTKKDKEVVMFTDCATEKEPCTTVRLNGEVEWEQVGMEGDIETFPLNTTLVDHGESFLQLSETGMPEKSVEPAEGEAWTLFTSAAPFPYEGLQAAYECNGVARIFTAGALAGVTTPVNAMGNTLTITFKEGKGLQNLFSEAEGGAAGTKKPIGRGIEQAQEEIEVTGTPCANNYCEPTLVAGVKISVPEGTCSAGPMLTEGNETFLLTAGHCFAKEKFNAKDEPEPCDEEGTISVTVASKWPSGLQPSEEIGKTGYFICNKKFDIAEIKIDNAFWATAPRLVEWVATPRAKLVEGEAASTVGQTNKRDGVATIQTEGTVLSDKGKYTGTKNLVEDTANAEKGDSGGPFFIAAPGGGVDVQGTLVGALKETLNDSCSVQFDLDGKTIKNVSPANIALIKELVDLLSKGNKVHVKSCRNPGTWNVEKVKATELELNRSISNGTSKEAIYFEASARFYEPMNEILKALNEGHKGWKHKNQKLFTMSHG